MCVRGGKEPETGDVSPSPLVGEGLGRGGRSRTSTRLEWPVDPAGVIVDTMPTILRIALAVVAAYAALLVFLWLIQGRLIHLPHVPGRDDEIAPISHGRRIHAAAPQPKDFLALSGGHNDAFLVSRARYLAELRRFLDAYLY